MTEVINNPAGNPSVVISGEGNGYNHHGYNQGYGLDLNSYGALIRDISVSSTDTTIAVEKIGAANLLATEKIGAASALAAAQNTAALAAQIAQCCCDTKALILATDAQRIRDELALLQTQFLIVTGGVTPSRGRIAA